MPQSNIGPAVLITGASGGIGQALVKAFHKKGYYIIATDIISTNHTLPIDCFVQADIEKTVVDEDYANKVFFDIKKQLPTTGLSALINNAAIQLLGSPSELNRSAWQRTLNVNLLAPFFWIQALLPELKKAKGSVVNISSIHAQLTKKHFACYATSKAALSALTRSLAIDLGADIKINALEPAAVETAMLLEGFDNNRSQLDQLAACHPIGRVAKADEIAQAAIFLCSNKSSFIQGSTLPVSGGIHACLNDPE